MQSFFFFLHLQDDVQGNLLDCSLFLIGFVAETELGLFIQEKAGHLLLKLTKTKQ